MTEQAQLLLESYEDLTWESYIEICNAITRIDKSQLEDELSRQAQINSYYTGLLALARRDYEARKLMYEQERACKGKKIGEGHTLFKKKITDKALEIQLDCDENIKELASIEIEAKYKMGLLKALVESMEHKKDMLVQMAAKERQETKLYS